MEAQEAQIKAVEDQIKAVEEQIEQAGQKFSSAIQDGNQYLADVWRDEEKQLREEETQLRKKETQLREEKKKLREKEFAAAKPIPDDISSFWGSLTSAQILQEVVEVDSNIVESSVSLPPPESSSELRVYKRRKPSRVHVELNKLKLAAGTQFMHVPIDELYVRKVYVKFTDIAFAILRGQRTQRAGGATRLVRHMFVTGSPGNGKTMWGNYLLYRLCKEDSFADRAIVWEDCPKQGPGVSYYFKGRDVRVGCPGDFDWLLDKKAIFLVNGPVLRVRQMVSHIIMFCSAEDPADSTWQVTKDSIKHTVYMPMWDLCELVLAGKMVGMSYDYVKQQHEKFGGSARSVLFLSGDNEWCKKFDDTLSAVKDKATLSYSVGSMLEAKDSSSFIFHLKVMDEECMEDRVVFASRYVEDTICSLAQLEDLASVVEYVNKYSVHKDEGVLVGKTFQYLFHRLITCSRASEFDFRARKIDSRETTSMRLSVVHKLGEIPDASICYFVPDYNTYPSVLFMTDKTYAFQATINTRHPALLDYVEKLLEDHLLTKFFYVVPERIFMEFPVQKCRHGSVEYEWPPDVEVWVLEIPADFFNFHRQQ